MSTRHSKSSHLGERRFLEYPQFVADELSLTGDFAHRVLAERLATHRRALGVAVALLVATGALLYLFG